MDNPELYAQTSLMQTRDAIEFLEEQILKLKWNDDELLLDVGCGPGNLTYHILLPFVPPNIAIVGCDISEEMLKFARSKYKDKRLSFKQLDIEHRDIWNNWQQNTFDKIFSFFCLHWISNRRVFLKHVKLFVLSFQEQNLHSEKRKKALFQAVRNMYNLLKEGGQVYLLFLSHNPMHTLYEKVSNNEQWKKYIKNTHGQTISNKDSQNCLLCEYTTNLKKVGFKEVEASIQRKSFWYQSMECLMCSIVALDPYIKLIPKELKTQYIEVLKKIILDEKLAMVIQESGKVKVEYTLLVLLARK